NLARNYRGARYAYDLPVAAYRLYTLVLADQAELPAMNRLREQLRQETRNPHARLTASWMLGLAYHHLGLTDAANDVLGKLNNEVPGYEQHGYTYGSVLRDRSLLLITLLRSGQAKNDLTWQVAEQIAAELSSDSWLSTQSLSWALIAMSEFSREMSGNQPIEFSIKTTQAGDWQNLNVDQTFYQQKLNQSDVWLRNDSAHDIRVMVSNRDRKSTRLNSSHVK